MARIDYTLASEKDTIELGRQFANLLPPGSILCLFGDLGVGKTTFVKGVAASLAHSDYQVSSPTFNYLNIYTGKKTIYHFDLYRLRDADEFLGMGFDDMLFANGICCIEWSERIASILPSTCIKVEMSHVEHSIRQIKITIPNEGNGLHI